MVDTKLTSADYSKLLGIITFGTLLIFLFLYTSIPATAAGLDFTSLYFDDAGTTRIRSRHIGDFSGGNGTHNRYHYTPQENYTASGVFALAWRNTHIGAVDNNDLYYINVYDITGGGEIFIAQAAILAQSLPSVSSMTTSCGSGCLDVDIDKSTLMSFTFPVFFETAKEYAFVTGASGTSFGVSGRVGAAQYFHSGPHLDYGVFAFNFLDDNAEAIFHFQEPPPPPDSLTLSVTPVAPYEENQNLIFTANSTIVTFQPNYCYYSYDIAETPLECTLNSSGSFTFSYSYDYAFTYQPYVELRDTPLGIPTSNKITDFLNISISGSTNDQTSFTVSNTSIEVGDSVEFSWSIDTITHSSLSGVFLDVGYPAFMQNYIDLTLASTGTYIFQYNDIPPSSQLSPRLLLVKQGETLEFTRTIILTTFSSQDVSIENYDVGGTTEVNNLWYTFKSLLFSYDLTEEVHFLYYYSTNSNLTYVSTDFYSDVNSSPIDISTVPDGFNNFNYKYNDTGIFSPRITLNYLSGTGTFSHDIFLGGSNNSALAQTISIRDYNSFCQTQPLFTDSGIFKDCQLFIVNLPAYDFINSTVNFFIYGAAWLTSYVYSVFEEIWLVDLFESFVDPDSGVYTIHYSRLGLSGADGNPLFQKVDTVIIPTRRNSNSNDVDNLIHLFLYFWLIRFLFNKIISFFKS